MNEDVYVRTPAGIRVYQQQAARTVHTTHTNDVCCVDDMKVGQNCVQVAYVLLVSNDQSAKPGPPLHAVIPYDYYNLLSPRIDVATIPSGLTSISMRRRW